MKISILPMYLNFNILEYENWFFFAEIGVIGAPTSCWIIPLYKCTYMMDHRISDCQICRALWDGLGAQWVKEGHFSSRKWTLGHQTGFKALMEI